MNLFEKAFRGRLRNEELVKTSLHFFVAIFQKCKSKIHETEKEFPLKFLCRIAKFVQDDIACPICIQKVLLFFFLLSFLTLIFFFSVMNKLTKRFHEED